MSTDKQWIGQQQGFTLIEVMFALFIFLVIALGLAAGEISALRAQTDNLLRDQALKLAEDQLNNLRSQRFTLDGGEAPALNATGAWTPPDEQTVTMRGGVVNFTRRVQITDIAASATALKRIDVVIGWNQGNNPPLQPTNRNHQTLLSTIIARSEKGRL
ncbi:MAG: prepilin-type N-terminal cleavage/methylation domain-containing protein [Desulfobulbus sp.]|nr:prepilin-type N-terminal cleavage/methylation domain-containing protein [Desulfobulbus sp.]